MNARLVLLLAFVPYLAYGTGVTELYSKDYKTFWREWTEIKIAAMECRAPEKMAEFLSLAVETLGNAEVYEANAKEVEAKVMSDAECVLRGLRLLKEDEQRKAIGYFLAKPLFTESSKIENALMSVWGNGSYAALRNIYEGDSKHR